MTAPARENRFASASTASGRPPGGAFGAPRGAQPDPEPEEKKPSKFKSKKFRIIAIVALLVVGGGAYTFLKPKPAYVPSGDEIVALDAQTLNLQGGHYLKVDFSVQLLKGKAKAADFKPAQASQLVIEEYSNRTVDSLASNSARTALQKDLLARVKKAYPDQIWDVFNTQFVTQ